MRLLTLRPPGTTRLPSALRNRLLPAAAALLAVQLMCGVAAHRVEDAAQRYGYDRPGDLGAVVVLGAAEMAVLYLVLRPWSYHRAWARAAFAWLAFLPWTLFYGAATMHAGPTMAQHFVWLLVVSFALFVTMVGSAAARVQFRRPGSRGAALRDRRTRAEE